MLRRILAPLGTSGANAGEGDVATPAAVYRREPPPSYAKDVTVSHPQDFRLRAHVECDPNTGLYSGMDEFLTLAVSSKGRRRPSAPPTLDGLPRLHAFGGLDGLRALAAESGAEASPPPDPPFPPLEELPLTSVARSADAGKLPAHAAPTASSTSPQRRYGGVQPAASLEHAGESVSRPMTPPSRGHTVVPAVLKRSPSVSPLRGGPSMRRPPRMPGASAHAQPSTTSANGPSPTKRKSPRRLGGAGSASTRSLFEKPSRPTDVTHAVHVRVDPTHPTGFAGLPPAWETILLFSGIERDEALMHPQEVVDVLNFSKAHEAPRSVTQIRTSSSRPPRETGTRARIGISSRDAKRPEHQSAGAPDTASFPDPPLQSGALPVRFSFPRTPTVTSFDDASDFAGHLSSDSSPGPGAVPTGVHALAARVPDLVLATECSSNPPPAGNMGKQTDVGEFKSLRDRNSRDIAAVPEANRQLRDLEPDDEPGADACRPCPEDPSRRLDFESDGEAPEKENLPRPRHPRSRGTGGGLAALASKCGVDVAPGSSDAMPSSNELEENIVRFSRTENEMQKIIGSDRVSHLPDCVPSDAVAMEIRCDDLHSIFSSITKIGEGSSGSVYSANRRQDGRAVAIKQVKPANERDWTLYRYEVHVMKSHALQENLVACYDAFRDGDYLFMVLELMTCSLADVLEHLRSGAFGRGLTFPAGDPPIDGTSRISLRKKSRVSSLAMASGCEEELIAYIAREVLKGLQHVHLIGRVHRDIKSDNILVRDDGSVKVADFGFCAELSGGKRNTVVGTPFQMAPEVIRGRDYGTAVDIWSVGILAYELAEGAPPHEGLPPIRAMFLIATSDPPTLGGTWSDELRDFVSACCTLDPSRRPTAADALGHPFISRACSREAAGRAFERNRKKP